jgi:predicted Rdx family selenoprotein
MQYIANAVNQDLQLVSVALEPRTQGAHFIVYLRSFRVWRRIRDGDIEIAVVACVRGACELARDFFSL